LSCPDTAKCILLDDLPAAEDQHAHGVTAGAKDKENRVWYQWTEYCRIICNEHDIFLQELPPGFCTQLFGVFAAALQKRQFSRLNERPLGASTVEEAMAKIGSDL
jgi:hypothetical protein